jgi:hypothetical protein
MVDGLGWAGRMWASLGWAMRCSGKDGTWSTATCCWTSADKATCVCFSPADLGRTVRAGRMQECPGFIYNSTATAALGILSWADGPPQCLSFFLPDQGQTMQRAQGW